MTDNTELWIWPTYFILDIYGDRNVVSQVLKHSILKHIFKLIMNIF